MFPIPMPQQYLSARALEKQNPSKPNILHKMKTHLRTVLIISILLCSAWSIMAQTTSKNIRLGDEAFRAGRYRQAIDYYSLEQQEGNYSDSLSIRYNKSKRCDQISHQWKEAKNEGRVHEAYDYLQQLNSLNPNTEYQRQITHYRSQYDPYYQDSLRQVEQQRQEDEQAWQTVKKQATKQSYQDYINRYCIHTIEAQDSLKQAEIREDEQAWDFTAEINTKQAYEQYIQQGYTRHRQQAKQKIQYYNQEEQDWKKIQYSKDSNAIYSYITQYPASSFRPQAEERIHDLRDEAAWQRAQQINSIESYQHYINHHGNHYNEASEMLRIKQEQHQLIIQAQEAIGSGANQLAKQLATEATRKGYLRADETQQLMVLSEPYDYERAMASDYLDKVRNYLDTYQSIAPIEHTEAIRKHQDRLRRREEREQAHEDFVSFYPSNDIQLGFILGGANGLSFKCFMDDSPWAFQADAVVGLQTTFGSTNISQPIDWNHPMEVYDFSFRPSFIRHFDASHIDGNFYFGFGGLVGMADYIYPHQHSIDDLMLKVGGNIPIGIEWDLSNVTVGLDVRPGYAAYMFGSAQQTIHAFDWTCGFYVRPEVRECVTSTISTKKRSSSESSLSSKKTSSISEASSDFSHYYLECVTGYNITEGDILIGGQFGIQRHTVGVNLSYMYDLEEGTSLMQAGPSFRIVGNQAKADVHLITCAAMGVNTADGLQLSYGGQLGLRIGNRNNGSNFSWWSGTMSGTYLSNGDWVVSAGLSIALSLIPAGAATALFLLY